MRLIATMTLVVATVVGGATAAAVTVGPVPAAERERLRLADCSTRYARAADGIPVIATAPVRPQAVICGEEHLLCFPGEPYESESILIHEFRHVTHGPASKLDRFFPVRGNHDWDAPGERCNPYLDYSTLPGNERHDDFVWGPVHFFMIDNDGREPDGARPGSKQRVWFVEAAEAITSPFQVFVAHHPPHAPPGPAGTRATAGPPRKAHSHEV